LKGEGSKAVIAVIHTTVTSSSSSDGGGENSEWRNGKGCSLDPLSDFIRDSIGLFKIGSGIIITLVSQGMLVVFPVKVDTLRVSRSTTIRGGKGFPCDRCANVVAITLEARKELLTPTILLHHVGEILGPQHCAVEFMAQV